MSRLPAALRRLDPRPKTAPAPAQSAAAPARPDAPAAPDAPLGKAFKLSVPKPSAAKPSLRETLSRLQACPVPRFLRKEAERPEAAPPHSDVAYRPPTEKRSASPASSLRSSSTLGKSLRALTPPMSWRAVTAPLAKPFRRGGRNLTSFRPPAPQAPDGLERLTSADRQELLRLGLAYNNPDARAAMQPIDTVTYLVRALRHGRASDARASAALAEIAGALERLGAQPPAAQRAALSKLIAPLQESSRKLRDETLQVRLGEIVATMNALRPDSHS